MAKFLASPLLLVRLATLLCALNVSVARAVDSDVPTKPTRYFNDYALALKPGTAERLNERLADFERETSNQLLVVIYPRLKTEGDVADFAQRTFRAWQPGQQGRDNGAILFVFLENHKLWIQTGRGLEGAIPDALARRIVGDEIDPKFRAGDLDGGLDAGVTAMIAAAKGEYQGTGRTVAQRRDTNAGGSPFPVFLLLIFGFFIVMTVFRSRARRGTLYDGGGYRGLGGGPIFIPMGGGGSFGGFGGGGGGGGSVDSGAFESGGGDSGGGGAGGDW